MHQQPPQTPLFASTRAAKSSQVSGVSRRVVYGVTTDVTVLLSCPGLRTEGRLAWQRPQAHLAADLLDQGAEELPGLVVVDVSGMGAAKPAHVDGDVSQVPAQTVEVQKGRSRARARRVGIGVKDAPVPRVQAPQVTL